MNVRKILAGFVLMALTVTSLVLITPAAQAEARWWTYSNSGTTLRPTSIFSSANDFNALTNRVNLNSQIYRNRYTYAGNANNQTYYRAANNANYRWIRSSARTTSIVADRNFYNRMNFNNRYNFISSTPSMLNASNIYFYNSSDPNSVVYIQNVAAGTDTLNQAYVMMSSADFMNLLRGVDGLSPLNVTLNPDNRTVQFYTPSGAYQASGLTMSFY
jgi:hypothetical protein